MAIPDSSKTPHDLRNRIERCGPSTRPSSFMWRQSPVSVHDGRIGGGRTTGIVATSCHINKCFVLKR